jgi:CBS domain-containing protein
VARTLSDLMTTRVVSARTGDTVAAVVERMTRYGFGALPVVTSTGRLVGVVSLLDVLRYREAHAEEGLEADEHAPVEEIMNPDVVSMAPTANVAAVARRLAQNGQLRVMPVERGGRLVGVVTRSDLLRGVRDDADGVADEDALGLLVRERRTAGAADPATPVREVMTTEVVAVTADDPIVLAGGLMLRDRHPSLPVVDADGKVVGVISEADILADPYAGRRAHATVGSVMTRGAVGIEPDATVAEARSVVADRGLRMLPVVDRGVLVGVLSRSDLV